MSAESKSRWLMLLALLVISPSPASSDERIDFFEKKIRPVLVEHCYECHSSQAVSVEGGLSLDSRTAMMRGGESGSVIEPGDAAASAIVAAIKYESLEMPPDRKLSKQVIADFEKWITDGAADPREEVSAPAEEVRTEIDFDKGREFWAFQPPTCKPLPSHAWPQWPRNRIDHFIAARLQERALKPGESAESSLLRARMAFDLTGLPPESTEWDKRPDGPHHKHAAGADEAYLMQLLESPAFGEHWARMWLDVMRFAEDQAHIVGNNRSLCFPNAYLYRDWVIDAFNQDMPYDRFLRLQLAADLISPDDPDDDVALGFIGLGPKYYRRSSPEVMADEWEDRIDTVTRGLQGLTVACARCHDHKYDPISTADYYALAGVFASTEMYNRPLDAEREIDKGQAKNPEDALHIVRDSSATDLAVMVRGDVNRKGPVVARRFLTVLCPDQPEEFRSTSGRLELAEALTNSSNPLTARVFVNRVWMRLVGQPLVGTPSNFGKLGQRPSHPDLLDDLASRFMQNGWSLKWLCREIVTSATYRQSSESSLANEQIDAENRFLWRMNRKRLSVEQLRDRLLAAAGKLDCRLYGTSIDPADPQMVRRTLYSEVSRLKLNPMLALFDFPDPNAHSSQRFATTTASQKLFFLNSPFVVETASDIARRISAQSERPQEQVQLAYRSLFARKPSKQELQLGRNFLRDNPTGVPGYIHSLLMTNEFLFTN